MRNLSGKLFRQLMCKSSLMCLEVETGFEIRFACSRPNLQDKVI